MLSGILPSPDQHTGCYGESTVLLAANTDSRATRGKTGEAMTTFGEKLRALLAERNMSQRQLARLVPCDTGHLSKVCNGNKRPSAALAGRLDELLAANGELVALVPPRKAAPAPGDAPARLLGTVDDDPAPDLGDEMERRALLQLLAALGAGTAAPSDALEAVRTRLDGTVATAADADEWQAVAWEYGHTLLTVPANVVITQLAVDVVEIRRALERARTPTARSGLQRASAQTAAVMAMALHDTGDLPAAWRWWRTARHAADASGDRDLQVWTRAREAHNGRFGLRHEATVTKLNNTAVALADGKPSAGLAAALSTKAALAAEHGNKGAAHAALDELETVHGQLPTADTSEMTTVWAWDESRLWQARGGTYGRLGDTGKARVAHDKAATLCPPERVAYHAAITLRTSLCDVHDGELGYGLDSAVTALSGLPPQWCVTFVTQTARDVLAALPDDKARALPAARELRALTAGA